MNFVFSLVALASMGCDPILIHRKLNITTFHILQGIQKVQFFCWGSRVGRAHYTVRLDVFDAVFYESFGKAPYESCWAWNESNLFKNVSS